MRTTPLWSLFALALPAALAAQTPVTPVVNLYSARHYQTDEALNPALETMGTFKADALPIATLGKQTATAQKIVDRAGWR